MPTKVMRVSFDPMKLIIFFIIWLSLDSDVLAESVSIPGAISVLDKLKEKLLDIVGGISSVSL